MKAYVAVTDPDWYRYLAARPEIREANFWRPYGGRQFKVLDPGEPFIFKTKAPDNFLVGGGIYEGFVSLPISRAWEIFGEGNGVESADRLIARIRSITRESREQIGDREIGCILLRDLHFVSADERIPTPSSFTRNTVQGRGYECPGGDPVIDAMAQVLLGQADAVDLFSGENAPLGPTRGEPRLVTPRLGQGGFKALVEEAYGRRCAVTGHRILPTLQAAHVLPVASGGQHRVDNGILLRSDVHTLFDRGYLGVDDRYRLRVSPRLRSEFGNGEEFYSREGSVISLPSRVPERPSPDFLTWHLTHVFR